MRLGAYLVDRRPLAVPAFRRLWTASVVTAVGGSFSVVAVPTQLFAMTGSSATVGLAATVTLVALTASALWSGVLADVLDRRRLLLASDAVLGVGYLGLGLQALLGLQSVPVVLALVAVQGTGFGATMTTLGAAVPRVVAGELLVAANGLSSVTRYVGAVLGPLLAGVLLPVVGPGPLYLCDAVALSAVLWAVARLPAMPANAQPSGSRPVRASLLDGARYLFGQRILVGIVAVDLAATVFGMPVALYPELAAHTFGPGSLGLLFAAYPAGVLVAGLASGTFSRVRRHGAMMAGAAIAWGACVVVLAATAQLWLALTALVLGGAVNFALSTFRNAISQAHTDDALRGRIQGILTVVLIGGPQVANVIHGLGGAVFGPRWTIGLGGTLTIAAVMLVSWRLPQLRHYLPAPGPPGRGPGSSNHPCLRLRSRRP